MRRTAADRAYVVLVRVNYLRARFTTLSRRQHGYARIWFCCAALSRLQTLLLLSERNLNKFDRVEPTRLPPSNDFFERTVGSLQGQVVLVLTEDYELNDQEHSRRCYIPLNAQTADLFPSGTFVRNTEPLGPAEQRSVKCVRASRRSPVQSRRDCPLARSGDIRRRLGAD